METHDNRFSELVDLVKSWLPQRPKPVSVSRTFWMPDHSCRVCYECDSQFTIFNRRHHCRLCGRVFCGRCTSNSVPISSDEAGDETGELERIRACNYCFKQWEQNQVAFENTNQGSSPVLSNSPSAMSLISMKSTGTCNSSNTYQRTGFNAGQSVTLEHYPERQDVLTKERNMDSLIPDPSRDPFGFCMNRSEDEEDEYPHRSVSDARQFHRSKEYYVPDDFDVDHEYRQGNSHPSEEVNDQNYTSSPQDRGTAFESSSSINKMIDDTGQESMCHCEASSSIYNIEGTESHHVETEPVDFDNNGLLWLPPEAEDDEEDRETGIFEDDEEDSAGEWGNLQSPSSSSCAEFQIRDRPSDDHRKAMKHVVDGHFRALISQLLQVENLPVGEDDERESWLRIITSLSWEAATLLKPDTSRGDGMDPAGYLKIKCLARGLPSESMVIKGIVCKKNVAHRRMTARIEKARFLILGGALEYHRRTNSLSSVDTLLQQETDHLKMAVAKIDAQHPNVLLVEKSVSRFAQDCLLGKGISLVLNMRRPLLDRIARCTGAQIVPSVDNLSPQMIGHCELFHVEKFLEEHGSVGQEGKKLVKTLMFFEGCPKPLGCTVLLKGASGDELKKVKHIVQYGVFAAYHLALETSFLADEGASLSELPLNSPIHPTHRDKQSTLQRSVSVVPGFTIPTGSIRKVNSSVQMVNKIPDLDLPVTAPGLQEKFEDPLSPQRYFVSTPFNARSLSLTYSRVGHNFGGQRSGFSRSQSLPVEGIPPPELSEELKEDFPPSPSDHQSILVSLSTRCVWKGTVCERAHLFRIKYYGSFDKPLGRFLRDHLFDQGYRCRSCDMPSEAHVLCYTHQQGSLIISVKKLPDLPLTGEKDGKIWMWHRCLQCPRVNKIPPATRRVVMSDAAWGLSFGKFLELSFSNHAATSRVASCGHSLHRDCLRFYGFGKMVACFRYASIVVHSVYLPPSKLDFNHQHQEWVQKEAEEVASQAASLFSEVTISQQRIAGCSASNNAMDSTDGTQCLVELQGTLQKERAQFEESLQRILTTGKGQPPIDILEVNKLRRLLLFQAYVWDKRLVSASSSPKGKEKVNASDLTRQDTRPKVNGAHEFDLRGVQSQGRLSLDSADFFDHLSQPSASGPVRGTYSEGQFSSISNLSNSLDAKWTGEGSEPSEATLSNGQSGSSSGGCAIPSPYTAAEVIQNQPTEDTTLYHSFFDLEHIPVHIHSFTDLERQAGSKVPLGVNDTVVPVYDDEPSSIIACALTSLEYISKAAEDVGDYSFAPPPSSSSFFSDDVSLSTSMSISAEPLEETLGSRSSSIDPLLYTKALHIRVSLCNKYSVVCYFGRRFEALRRACCPSETDFIRSLSRCKKWGAQGGKSNVFFAKTLDERFIIKQVTKTELESFILFGPEYFKYLSESISTGSPTCLAKILGIYQVATRTGKGGKEAKMEVLVMENLLFGRSVVRVYDLKGSTRSRYNSDCNGANKVLLDQNLIEAMPTSPIFVGNKAKRLLERAVWNDTAFLASVDVMDYSLLVGVDEERGELVLGIIDFMRQYTWDKHLETWVKASGILGGPKNVSPTVISPKQYKKRFRKAMSAYFLMVPDQWSLPIIVPGDSLP